MWQKVYTLTHPHMVLIVYIYLDRYMWQKAPYLDTYMWQRAPYVSPLVIDR